MIKREQYINKMAETYDQEAEAAGWYGPEVSFGLTYKYIQPNQSLLDIGIGTGLGSVLFRKAGLKVFGMDNSEDMLDACRGKGFTDLVRHDLNMTPYPYEAEAMDLVICVGVMIFFSDLSSVFRETARILRSGGLFVFAVADRAQNESHEFKVGAEHTKTGNSVTMFRHDVRQVENWIERSGFELLRSLTFIVFMNPKKTIRMRANCYLVKKADWISS
jgi:predicted TPR repeat methyltransferase